MSAAKANLEATAQRLIRLFEEPRQVGPSPVARQLAPAKTPPKPPSAASRLKDLHHLQSTVQTMLTDTLLYDRRGLGEFRRLSTQILTARQLLNAAPSTPEPQKTRTLTMVDDLLRDLAEAVDAAARSYGRFGTPGR